MFLMARHVLYIRKYLTVSRCWTDLSKDDYVYSYTEEDIHLCSHVGELAIPLNCGKKRLLLRVY